MWCGAACDLCGVVWCSFAQFRLWSVWWLHCPHSVCASAFPRFVIWLCLYYCVVHCVLCLRHRVELRGLFVCVSVRSISLWRARVCCLCWRRLLLAAQLLIPVCSEQSWPQIDIDFQRRFRLLSFRQRHDLCLVRLSRAVNRPFPLSHCLSFNVYLSVLCRSI